MMECALVAAHWLTRQARLRVPMHIQRQLKTFTANATPSK